MDVAEEKQRVDAAYLKRSQHDFLLFAQGLVIPSASGPQPLRVCLAPFQKACFKDLEPSLKAVRDGDRIPPKRRFWIERTKKASKDGDLAIAMLWLVAFATRPLFLQAAAADRDQAAIVKRRMEDILHYNPWLNAYVKITSNKVEGTNGLATIDIIAADVAGSHGETPHLLLINELSHVTKWEFIENLLDNATGVPWGVVIIATNAGFLGTKAHKLKQVAESEKHCVHVWSKPAPWLSQEDLREAKLRNIPSRYKRLYQGVWASGKGDAFDTDKLDNIFIDGLQEMTVPERGGWTYLAGLDLGVNHDHAGFVICGVNRKLMKIRLARMRAWEPGSYANHEIELQDVEDHILGVHKLFRTSWVGYDPDQAVHLAQRLRRKGVPMEEVRFSGRSLPQMAAALMSLINKHVGIFEAYDDEDGRLRRDLGKFNIVEKSYGYRLEAVSDEFGHADVGTALAILLPKALDMLGIGRAPLEEDDVIATVVDEEPPDEKELQSWPQELRDIYDMDYGHKSRNRGDDL